MPGIMETTKNSKNKRYILILISCGNKTKHPINIKFKIEAMTISSNFKIRSPHIN